MADHVKIREKRFAPGDVILSEDEPASDLFVLRSGKVKVTKRGRGGREHLLDVLGPGSIFGEMAILDKKNRSATVTAETSVRCVLLAHHFLEQQMRQTGPWTIAILRMLVIRLRSTTTQLAAERARRGQSTESQLDMVSEKQMQRVLDELPAAGRTSK